MSMSILMNTLVCLALKVLDKYHFTCSEGLCPETVFWRGFLPCCVSIEEQTLDKSEIM